MICTGARAYCAEVGYICQTSSGRNVHFLVSVIFFSFPQTRIIHQTIFNKDRLEVALSKLEYDSSGGTAYRGR